MKLDSNRRSSFLLQYELIVATNNKSDLITNDISNKIKDDFIRIGKSHNVTLLDWENHGTHIIVSFKAHPNTELSKFVNAYKSASSRLIKKDYPAISEQLIEGKFWAGGFCVMSLGAEIEKLREEYLKTL